jgi:hypothetical protein
MLCKPVLAPASSASEALQWLEQALTAVGLQQRGHFLVGHDDSLPGPTLANQTLLVLVGNVGSTFWPHFAESDEVKDGLPDPLDRWSQRMGAALAARCNGQAYYPFGGPPHYPFLRWAAKAEALGASALGLRIHPVYGLWHAYRFALQIPINSDQPGTDPPWAGAIEPNTTSTSDVCIQCDTKACLSTCPVEAFSPSGYDVAACVSHLYTLQASDQASTCVTHACQARIACPIGTPFQYSKAHGHFHMQQFMLAQRLPGREN